MIREEEVFPIGRLTRVRGTAADLEMTYTDDALDRGTSEYVVLRLDGILVPFFWEEYRFKNDRQIILRLEDVETPEQARRLVGAEVLYPYSEIDEDDKQMSFGMLQGFTVEDVATGPVGRITSIDDRSENIILYVETPDGREVLLPFHEDLVADFRIEEKTITLRLPEGLMNL